MPTPCCVLRLPPVCRYNTHPFHPFNPPRRMGSGIKVTCISLRRKFCFFGVVFINNDLHNRHATSPYNQDRGRRQDYQCTVVSADPESQHRRPHSSTRVGIKLSPPCSAAPQLGPYFEGGGKCSLVSRASFLIITWESAEKQPPPHPCARH